MLFIGAEAADETTIKKYNKKIQPLTSLDVATLLWEEYGIFPHYSYVISYPIEDLTSVRRTLELRLSVSKLVGAPTGELGFYNPTVGTSFLEEYKEFFNIPNTFDEWEKFNFLKQDLYKKPSKKLNNIIMKHHIQLIKMFPDVEAKMIFDIWQKEK